MICSFVGRTFKNSFILFSKPSLQYNIKNQYMETNTMCLAYNFNPNNLVEQKNRYCTGNKSDITDSGSSDSNKQNKVLLPTDDKGLRAKLKSSVKNAKNKSKIVGAVPSVEGSLVGSTDLMTKQDEGHNLRRLLLYKEHEGCCVKNISSPMSIINRREYFKNVNQIKKKKRDKNNNVKFINVNKEKWPYAPDKLDMNDMIKFPLYNKSELNDNVSNTSNIISIDIGEHRHVKLPSVRKIIEETMSQSSKIALKKWKANMILELGENGFEEYQKELFNRGKVLHECIECKVSGGKPEDSSIDEVAKLWDSLSHVLPDVSKVQALESHIVHPHMHYHGIVDCVASYKGLPIVIEWKTSNRIKSRLSHMYDAPLQLVAYLGALNYDDKYTNMKKVSEGMMVVAYDSGIPAHTHYMSSEVCQQYWTIWCTRLVEYWKLQQLTKTV